MPTGWLRDAALAQRVGAGDEGAPGLVEHQLRVFRAEGGVDADVAPAAQGFALGEDASYILCVVPHQ
jgi:hypothetical protein